MFRWKWCRSWRIPSHSQSSWGYNPPREPTKMVMPGQPPNRDDQDTSNHFSWSLSMWRCNSLTLKSWLSPLMILFKYLSVWFTEMENSLGQLHPVDISELPSPTQPPLDSPGHPYTSYHLLVIAPDSYSGPSRLRVHMDPPLSCTWLSLTRFYEYNCLLDWFKCQVRVSPFLLEFYFSIYDWIFVDPDPKASILYIYTYLSV